MPVSRSAAESEREGRKALIYCTRSTPTGSKSKRWWNVQYRPQHRVEIALWVTLLLMPISVVEALRHAVIAADGDLYLRWINAEDLETEGAERYLEGGMVC